MCYEEAVVKININVGDDIVGVEKPPRGVKMKVRVSL